MIFHNMRMSTVPAYFSFLVRLWCEENTDTRHWRMTTRNLATDECRNFADFEKLMEYLREHMAEEMNIHEENE